MWVGTEACTENSVAIRDHHVERRYFMINTGFLLQVLDHVKSLLETLLYLFNGDSGVRPSQISEMLHQ